MSGKLVHFEIPAQDPARAKEFYGSLFGWRFQQWDGPVEYHMFEGEPGGGLYPSQSGESGAIIYFDTDEINSAVERVKELGGSAEEVAPVPGMGWYARCKDTEGNEFSLWQTDESATASEA